MYHMKTLEEVERKKKGKVSLDGGALYKHVVVIDGKHLSLKHLRKKLLDRCKATIAMDHILFPESLETLYIGI